MSFISQLMHEIAKEINKPPEFMAKFIQDFQDNLYDTEESLRTITDAELNTLKIPMRIISIMKRKLAERAGILSPSAAPAFNIPSPSTTTEPVSTQTEKMELQKPKQSLINIKGDQYVDSGLLGQIVPKNKMEEEQKKPARGKKDNSPERREDDYDDSNFKKISQQEKWKAEEIGDDMKLVLILEDLTKYIKDNLTYRQTLSVLSTILNNIYENPNETQFYRVKLSGPKFVECVAPYQPALNFLKFLKFERKPEHLELDPQNYSQFLFEAGLQRLVELDQIATIDNFDPYQSIISSTTSMTNNQMVSDGTDYYGIQGMINQLQVARQEIMSQKIVNRHMKVYQVNRQYDSQAPVNEFEDEKYESNWQNPKFNDSIKQFKNEEEISQFSSRAQLEYEQLVNTPVYSETQIRVHFPDDIVFEAIFSPMESMKNFVDYLAQHLEDPTVPFYLYRAPPLEKFTTQNWNSTLYDLNAIPNEKLYFGMENEKLLLQKKYFLQPELLNSILSK